MKTEEEIERRIMIFKLNGTYKKNDYLKIAIENLEWVLEK